MPKHPHILKRDGRYYYRRRIPLELVRAGCYGKAKDIKRALGTSDLAAANRLAMTLAIQVDEEFQVKRRELEANSKFARSCKTESECRWFSDLSELERSDFVMRYFITKERKAVELRRETDPEIRQQLLWNIRDDLAAMEGELTAPQSNWIVELRKALKADGISTKKADAVSLHDLAIRIQRAAIEAAMRTESALRGDPFKTFDPWFSGIHADSPFPSGAKESKTVSDLCREYLAHNETRAEKGKLARSTLPKIEMRCRIMADFFGTGMGLDGLCSRMGGVLRQLRHIQSRSRITHEGGTNFRRRES